MLPAMIAVVDKRIPTFARFFFAAPGITLILVVISALRKVLSRMVFIAIGYCGFVSTLTLNKD